MSKWPILDEDPRIPYLDSTGFGWVRKLRPFKVSIDLLRCLLSRFDADKKVFKLGIDRMITLEDMICFTGMTMGRNQILLNSCDGPLKLCQDVLGMEPNEKNVKKGGVSHDWLISKFQKIEDKNDAEELKRSVRAYLLFVIGSVIFPTSSSHVSTQYLSYLKDLDKVKDYAWLCAMLACVLTSFSKKTSVSGVKYLDGCTPIIMLWAYEHYRALVPQNLTGCFEPEREIPLFVHWSRILEKKSAGSMEEGEFQNLVNNLEYSAIEVQYPADMPELKKAIRFSSIEAPFCHGTSNYMYTPRFCPAQFNDFPCSSTPKVRSFLKLKKTYNRAGIAHDWADTNVKKISVLCESWIIGDIKKMLDVEDSQSSGPRDVDKMLHIKDSQSPGPSSSRDVEDSQLLGSNSRDVEDSQSPGPSSSRDVEDSQLLGSSSREIKWDGRCNFFYPAGRCKNPSKPEASDCVKHLNLTSQRCGRRPKSRRIH